MEMATSPNALCNRLTYEYIFSVPLIWGQLLSDELSNGHLCVIWPIVSSAESPSFSGSALSPHHCMTALWQETLCKLSQASPAQTPTLRAFFCLWWYNWTLFQSHLWSLSICYMQRSCKICTQNALKLCVCLCVCILICCLRRWASSPAVLPNYVAVSSFFSLLMETILINYSCVWACVCGCVHLLCLCFPLLWKCAHTAVCMHFMSSFSGRCTHLSCMETNTVPLNYI